MVPTGPRPPDGSQGRRQARDWRAITTAEGRYRKIGSSTQGQGRVVGRVQVGADGHVGQQLAIRTGICTLARDATVTWAKAGEPPGEHLGQRADPRQLMVVIWLFAARAQGRQLITGASAPG